MKPKDWDDLDPTTKKSMAMELFNSMRGHYILSQALSTAMDALREKKYPETSNIEDMEILYEMLFPLFEVLKK